MLPNVKLSVSTLAFGQICRYEGHFSLYQFDDVALDVNSQFWKSICVTVRNYEGAMMTHRG